MRPRRRSEFKRHDGFIGKIQTQDPSHRYQSANSRIVGGVQIIDKMRSAEVSLAEGVSASEVVRRAPEAMTN
jgi:hypothetical protein